MKLYIKYNYRSIDLNNKSFQMPINRIIMNKSKKAIIVGASSGIGKALARELVKKQLFCWNNRQER